MAAAFRRVLVGFDGSPDAAEALRAGTAIAGLDGGHVVALSVVRHAPHYEGEADQDSESAALRRLAEACFDELRRGASSSHEVRMSVQVVLSHGESAGQVVTDYAAAHGFDILVLGRHGDGQAGDRGLARSLRWPPTRARCQCCC